MCLGRKKMCLSRKKKESLFSFLSLYWCLTLLNIIILLLLNAFFSFILCSLYSFIEDEDGEISISQVFMAIPMVCFYAIQTLELEMAISFQPSMSWISTIWSFNTSISFNNMVFKCKKCMIKKKKRNTL